jgi:hypothetical protein|tara:strand:- start:128 stop:841 length:714 start_codon:yes stop_codon:yes gene_type:complete
MKQFLLYIYRFIKKFLPAKFNTLIWDIYLSLLKHKSYSQYGEDLIIDSFFQHHVPIKNGNYLDIGCYHPIGISNTYVLHKRGWQGLVIDIDDYKLELFKRRRGKNVEALKGAISSEDSVSKVPIYKFNQPFSPYDTLSEEIAKMRSKAINIEYTTEEVNQISINSLLHKKHFDLINIDVEGLDELIVNSIDFKKFQPTMIVYESFDPFSSSKTKELLNDNGYTLLFISGGSIGYIKK